MNVEDIDLNLLKSLAALLDEASVSRAAARLGVTQPAMSSALKRLRGLFDDPLLVRTPTGMIATDKATRLKVRLAPVLAGVQGLLDDAGDLDPGRFARTVTIGLNDYASLLVLPRVIPLIRDAAPKLRIVVQPRKNVAAARSELESGALDFAIGIGDPKDLPGSLVARKLFDDGFMTMLRSDHAAGRKLLGLEQFLALDHLVVSPQGHDHGIIDEILAKTGQRRHVAVTVPHFAGAAQLVAATDLVCTIPARVAELYAPHFPIRIVKPPLALPKGRVALAWHAALHDNPVHRFVRAQFIRAFPDRQA